MASKSGNGKKRYYLYYWNGDNCWHLFESPVGKAGEERLKDLFYPAMTAIKCRRAEKVLTVSLPATKKAPKQLPKGIGDNPRRRDFRGTGFTLCKKTVPLV